MENRNSQETENINIPEYVASLQSYIRLVSETVSRYLLSAEGKVPDAEGAVLITEQFPKFVQRIETVASSEKFKQMDLNSQAGKVIPLGIDLRKLNEKVESSIKNPTSEVLTGQQFTSELENLVTKFES